MLSAGGKLSENKEGVTLREQTASFSSLFSSWSAELPFQPGLGALTQALAEHEGPSLHQLGSAAQQACPSIAIRNKSVTS